MADLSKFSVQALRGIRRAKMATGPVAVVRELTEEIHHREMQRNAIGTFIGCAGPACAAAHAAIVDNNLGRDIQAVR